MPLAEILDAFNPYYLRHPTTGLSADEAPLDAGSAHIVHHNATILSRQNTRLLGQCQGPGVVGYDTSTFAQWVGVVDAFEVSGADPYAQIPWVQTAQCVLFGPLPVVALEVGSRGYTPRPVRVLVECEKGKRASTTLTIMAVLTAQADTPLRTRRIAQARKDYPHTSPGAKVCQLDLSSPDPIVPAARWRSRDSGASLDSSVIVSPVWLWVGWSSNDISSADRVDSVSAFEVRT